MEQARIIILPTAIQTLVNKSWEFSCQQLWERELLTNEDVLNIREWIANYYSSIEPVNFQQCAEQYFEAFCKKIIEVSSGNSLPVDKYIFQRIILSAS